MHFSPFGIICKNSFFYQKIFKNFISPLEYVNTSYHTEFHQILSVNMACIKKKRQKVSWKYKNAPSRKSLEFGGIEQVHMEKMCPIPKFDKGIYQLKCFDFGLWWHFYIYTYIGLYFSSWSTYILGSPIPEIHINVQNSISMSHRAAVLWLKI